MPGAHQRRCLGPELSPYADRVLPEGELLFWDRHLVACACCRHAVQEERRILSSLRSAGGRDVPRDLRAMLLSLGAEAGAGNSPHVGGPPTPLRIPAPPVPVVDRSAPALHRSAVRATVFAGLAAGASAAAAWSFAVTGSPLLPPTPAATTPGAAVQRARPAVTSFVGASLSRRSALPGAVQTVVVRSAGAPVVSGQQARSAQSTP
jgi:hypothetical protein